MAKKKPTLNEQAAAEAKEWLETPFKWGQSQKGKGCDCKGLIRGVAHELGLEEAACFYAQFASYRPERPVPSDLLVEGMAAVFDRADEPIPGDVLLLKIRGKAAHLAIVSEEGKAIHAHGAGLNPKVKETRLAVLTKMFPVHSVWRWRCRVR